MQKIYEAESTSNARMPSCKRDGSCGAGDPRACHVPVEIEPCYEHRGGELCCVNPD